MVRVYKIVAPHAWEAAQAAGEIARSADDIRDGFIHLSTASQVAGTLARHFREGPAVVLVAVEAAALGEGLRWEASRGGEAFPHLYGALPLTLVTQAWPLSRGADGAFQLPALA